MNIKNEYSAIKPPSVMEDSFNNSGFMNTYMQQPMVSVNPNMNLNIKNEGTSINKLSSISTVSNTNITNNIQTKNNSNISKKKNVSIGGTKKVTQGVPLKKNNTMSSTMKKPIGKK